MAELMIIALAEQEVKNRYLQVYSYKGSSTCRLDNGSYIVHQGLIEMLNSIKIIFYSSWFFLPGDIFIHRRGCRHRPRPTRIKLDTAVDGTTEPLLKGKVVFYCCRKGYFRNNPTYTRTRGVSKYIYEYLPPALVSHDITCHQLSWCLAVSRFFLTPVCADNSQHRTAISSWSNDESSVMTCLNIGGGVYSKVAVNGEENQHHVGGMRYAGIWSCKANHATVSREEIQRRRRVVAEQRRDSAEASRRGVREAGIWSCKANRATVSREEIQRRRRVVAEQRRDSAEASRRGVREAGIWSCKANRATVSREEIQRRRRVVAGGVASWRERSWYLVMQGEPCYSEQRRDSAEASRRGVREAGIWSCKANRAAVNE
ncbi:hypothetical protein J6590_045890 [Homalodisca vitripennis]|nr:hypothetical protein J6590_045890 [Homalodisca vitripennis]